MGYYVIKYLSNTFTLQEDANSDDQVSKYVEITVKETYLSEMRSKTNWHW